MSNQNPFPRRPGSPPGSPPGSQAEEIFEDGIQSVGKAVRGVWDFLTSDDNAEFLRKTDEKNGTNFSALYEKARGAGVGDELRPDLLEGVAEGCIHTPPCKGPRCTVYSAAEAATVGSVVDAPVTEGEVVIVVEDEAPPPCTFCRGKQVIALKGGTRTAIACPTCKRSPAGEKRAPALKR